jgi:hypothetical protein
VAVGVTTAISAQLDQEDWMMTLQDKMVRRLKSLNDMDDVTVEVSGEQGLLHIRHAKHHAADFKFKWVDGNHYVGYFVDAHENESQAILSLWDPLEAVKFLALYMTLVDLKARR